jgi:predicted permease
MILTALASGALLFGLCLPGFLLRRFKKITDDGKKTISLVISYIGQTALSLYSFQINKYSEEILPNIGLSALFSLLSIVLCAVIARFVFAGGFKDKIEGNKDRTLGFISIFSNCGFLGIPFVQMLLPGNNEAVLYVAVYMAVFNALIWSIGVYFLSGESRYIKLTKVVLNPPTIALVVALPLFFTGTTLPDILFKGVEHLANISTPMSMILMGMYLAESKPRELVTDKKLYVAVAMRLILSPIVMLIVMLPFGNIDSNLRLACFVVSAMPSAAAAITMNDVFGTTEGSMRAARGQLVSTAISVLSVPMMLWLYGLIYTI